MWQKLCSLLLYKRQTHNTQHQSHSERHAVCISTLSTYTNGISAHTFSTQKNYISFNSIVQNDTMLTTTSQRPAQNAQTKNDKPNSCPTTLTFGKRHQNSSFSEQRQNTFAEWFKMAIVFFSELAKMGMPISIPISAK